jgi:hypothetical protein
MKPFVNNILNKTLVAPFYSQHAFVLGLVYLVMFGAVEGNQLYDYHCSLIEGMVTSYIALLIVLLIWGIYFFRTVYFLNQVLENKQFHFLQQISLLPLYQQQKYLLHVIITCLLPISTYAIAIMIWAIGHFYYWPSLIVFLFIMILHMYGVKLLGKRMQYLEQPKWFFKWFGLNFSLYKKWPIQFYIKYITHEQKLQYLVIKLIIILTLRALFNDRPLGDEIRFSTFFYAMVFLIHTNLIHKFIVWEATQFWHVRLLSNTVLKKMVNHLVLFMMLIIPEGVVIYGMAPEHITLFEGVSFFLLSIAMLLFIYTISKAFHNVIANFLPLLFLLLFLVYVAALADSLFVFASILFVVSVALYYYTENKFEIVINATQDGYT